MTARDFNYLCLLIDHGTSYEKTSCVIKILLTTQKSVENPYLICLNASQSEFNDAVFTQTYFRVHPPLPGIDKSLKKRKKDFRNLTAIEPINICYIEILRCQD